MINVKLGWEWMRFHLFTNKYNRLFVANMEFRPLGIEIYGGPNSTIVYLELGIGTLMLKLDK